MYFGIELFSYKTLFWLVVGSSLASSIIEWYRIYYLSKTHKINLSRLLLKTKIIRIEKLGSILIIGLSLLSESELSKVLLAFGVIILIEEVVRIILIDKFNYHRLIVSLDHEMIYFGNFIKKEHILKLKGFKKEKNICLFESDSDVIKVDSKKVEKSDFDNFYTYFKIHRKLKYETLKMENETK